MESVAVRIRRLNSGRDGGWGETTALSFTYAHDKTSRGVKSGDLGGHLQYITSLTPVLSIHIYGRRAFVWFPTAVWE